MVTIGECVSEQAVGYLTLYCPGTKFEGIVEKVRKLKADCETLPGKIDKPLITIIGVCHHTVCGGAVRRAKRGR